MGSQNSRVCIWSHYDFEQYQKTNLLPNCDHHDHCSRTEADELTRVLLYRAFISGTWKYFFEASWVDNRFRRTIMINDPRSWTVRRSGGYDVRQLAHIGS
jgi:hypothetical protein